ncbi:hypothetical protein LOD44_10425 [Xylella fastidiosa subsp. multiplex]|uniref:Uncharacterized protein n=2 Tax=Xylella fastidiosa TaxID=2371 RepID=A0A9Q4QT83_XYLFS|nr:hypothetical protein [Xylella fastidiosa]KAJ4851858.1 hypothetical protein XYFPCFBP8418_008030 [Xylella fastidiosa subsp. multiplex]KAJ4853492.1 hypothetical protein XYFPCFBP8418_004380 [Xylella fastidiosa subsp. multiplex]MBE0267817.1 hypothetical protein [Xylella fastidiosa subsp. multiplex]MBE0274400.1 hypothetical protein [Xylella fastidiosa subsp. multiplex]MBE0276797.1 hypothetical protein [Xylella fastidiosa subsp. multiplex]
MSITTERTSLTDLEHLFEVADGGILATKFAKALSDVALAINYTRKQGEVTLSLKLKPIGESSQVMIDHTLKYVEPKLRGKVTEEDTTSTPMYVGARGKLTLIPETQQQLFAEKNESSPIK